MNSQELRITTKSHTALTARLENDKKLQLMIHDDAVWEHMTITLDADQTKQLIDFLQLHLGNTPN